MSEHTPGPWLAINDPGRSSGSLIDNGGYRIDAPDDGVTQLAYVWVLNHRVPADGGAQENGPLFGDVRAAANARLIAAAPELLEACVLLVGASDDGPGEGMKFSDRIKKARDAIAKATGGVVI